MKKTFSIGQVIAKIWEIENSIDVKCLSYGLYDKVNKEYINVSNKEKCFDYEDAYENRNLFRYTYDKSLDNDFVSYLLKHHGEIYFPMLRKNDQKAYVAQFDVKTLVDKHGECHGVTPSEYFKDNFCFSNKSKGNQCEGQLVLQLII